MKWIRFQATHARIEKIYGREHALEVVQAAMADYAEEYGE
jgi:inorganic pyrophosphatase